MILGKIEVLEERLLRVSVGLGWFGRLFLLVFLLLVFLLFLRFLWLLQNEFTL